MTLDAEIIPVAVSILADLGKDVTFVEVTGQTVDTDDSTVTGGSTTNHTVKASPPERASHSYYNEARISGSLAEGKAFELTIATGTGTTDAIAFTPTTTEETGMLLSVDSLTYRILRVDPLYSGEQVAAYRVFFEE